MILVTTTLAIGYAGRNDRLEVEVESSAQREAAESREFNTRLLQALELSEYEQLVDRIAAALWRRSMRERQATARPEIAHRYETRDWNVVHEQIKVFWRDEARAALEGQPIRFGE